ncbi:HAD-IA family hydrolase [Streptococcus caprae]|uniref:HAD-IA family hydrolase n=1 Tax=Streptococcus caprae TaxID=1640501 RepID=A0ABV8CV19_9STRE
MKNLLFDLDGTLIDSSPGILNGFRYAFEKLGIEQPSVEKIKTFMGPPLEQSFQEYFAKPEDVDNAVKVYREYYLTKGMYEVSFYPGIEDLLDCLKTHPVNLFVATSKKEEIAIEMLENLKIDNYFTGIYGSTSERHNKFAVIEACLQDYQLGIETSYMIGDTKYDMLGGKEAQLTCIGVTWGYGSQTDLESHGADIICHQPEDIKKAFGF